MSTLMHRDLDADNGGRNLIVEVTNKVIWIIYRSRNNNYK